MNEQKLPGESSITTLWIVAISLTLLSFCCAVFTSIAGVIVSIVALRRANKNIRIYHENPEVYSPFSLSNVNTGKVVSIITLVISSMITLIYSLYFLVYGAIIGTALFGAWQSDVWENDTRSIEDDTSWDQEVIDDWADEIEAVESDTLFIESIELDSVN